MVLEWPKKAKKGIRKVQKYHKNDKICPNFALRNRRKMPKNDQIFAKGPTVPMKYFLIFFFLFRLYKINPAKQFVALNGEITVNLGPFLLHPLEAQ